MCRWVILHFSPFSSGEMQLLVIRGVDYFCMKWLCDMKQQPTVSIHLWAAHSLLNLSRGGPHLPTITGMLAAVRLGEFISPIKFTNNSKQTCPLYCPFHAGSLFLNPFFLCLLHYFPYVHLYFHMSVLASLQSEIFNQTMTCLQRLSSSSGDERVGGRRRVMESTGISILQSTWEEVCAASYIWEHVWNLEKPERTMTTGMLVTRWFCTHLTCKFLCCCCNTHINEQLGIWWYAMEGVCSHKAQAKPAK